MILLMIFTCAKEGKVGEVKFDDKFVATGSGAEGFLQDHFWFNQSSFTSANEVLCDNTFIESVKKHNGVWLIYLSKQNARYRTVLIADDWKTKSAKDKLIRLVKSYELKKSHKELENHSFPDSICDEMINKTSVCNYIVEQITIADGLKLEVKNGKEEVSRISGQLENAEKENNILGDKAVAVTKELGQEKTKNTELMQEKSELIEKNTKLKKQNSQLIEQVKQNEDKRTQYIEEIEKLKIALASSQKECELLLEASKTFLIEP